MMSLLQTRGLSIILCTLLSSNALLLYPVHTISLHRGVRLLSNLMDSQRKQSGIRVMTDGRDAVTGEPNAKSSANCRTTH